MGSTKAPAPARTAVQSHRPRRTPAHRGPPGGRIPAKRAAVQRCQLLSFVVIRPLRRDSGPDPDADADAPRPSIGRNSILLSPHRQPAARIGTVGRVAFCRSRHSAAGRFDPPRTLPETAGAVPSSRRPCGFAKPTARRGSGRAAERGDAHPAARVRSRRRALRLRCGAMRCDATYMFDATRAPPTAARSRAFRPAVVP